MRWVEVHRASAKRGRPHLFMNLINGHVTLIVNGPIYRFSIRLGRAIDLAMWERKDA